MLCATCTRELSSSMASLQTGSSGEGRGSRAWMASVRRGSLGGQYYTRAVWGLQYYMRGTLLVEYYGREAGW